MADVFINLPAIGAGSWRRPVATAADLPTSGNNIGDVRVVEDTDTIYVWTGSSWVAVATPGAAVAIDGLTGDVSASGPGVVPATVNFVGTSSATNVHSAELLANASTSSNAPNTIVKRDGSGNFSAGTITATLNGTATNVSGVVAIANGGTNSSAALNNNRILESSGGAIVEAAAITASRMLVSDTNGIPVAGNATTTEANFVAGVTSAIQTQLNGKQASGNYITALTGDVTASGPGSVAATIAVGAVTDTKASLANKPPVTVVATTNQALTGAPAIDGQLTVAGTSIVLLTAQSTGSQNGPWVVQSGAWTRPTWYPSGGATQAFQFITTLVRLGTTYQGTTWRMTTSGAIIIDTTATTWVVTPIAINASTITGLVPLANGGTNKNLTPVAGGLAWTDADSFEVSVAGTTGQAAISGGTGAPTWFAPTAGSVLFAGTGGILQQDNANLFWDDTNNTLGIGNAAPGATFRLNVTGPHLITSNSASSLVIGPNGTTNPVLQIDASTASSVTGLKVTSAASGNGILLNAISSASNEDIQIKAKGTGNCSIGAIGSGTVSVNINSQTRLQITASGTSTFTTSASTTNSPRFSWTSATDTGITTGEAPNVKFDMASTRQHGTGSIAAQRDFLITPGTHSYTGASTITNVATFAITGPAVGSTNATFTNVHSALIQTSATANATNAYGLSVNAPSGATNNYAAQFIGGNVGIGTAAPTAPLSVAETFKVATSGLTTQDTTTTAGGTTGNQTINKPTGSVNFAALATTLTVTNSLVSANSIVTAVVMINDTTALLKNVVPAAGSFVINLNAAATAETKVGFVVHN